MKVKNLVLGIGLVVVFALLLWQGIEAFYPSEKYEDYCTNLKYSPYPSKLDVVSNPAYNCTLNKQAEEEANTCVNQGGIVDYEYDNK